MLKVNGGFPVYYLFCQRGVKDGPDLLSLDRGEMGNSGIRREDSPDPIRQLANGCLDAGPEVKDALGPVLED